MRTLQTWVLGIGILVVLFSNASAEVKIGVAAPLTGPSAAFGAQIRNGVEHAISEINSTGGVLGEKVVGVYEDDRSDVRQGIEIANEFAAADIKFVIGDFNSDVTLAASEIYLRYSILEITPSSTNPKITDRGMWNVVRTCGRDDQQGQVAANHILRNFRGKKIAILHDRTLYGEGLADEVRKGIRSGGLTETYYDGIVVGERDYSPVILKLKSLAPDLVYWGGLDHEAAILIREMRDEGIGASFMSGDGIASEEFAELVGPDAEGTLMTSQPDPRNRPQAKVVVESFRRNGFEPESYTLYSYAAVEVIKQAAELAGTIDARAISEKIISGVKFRTALGDISFNSKGDVIRSDYVMNTWKKDNSGNLTYRENK